MSNYTKPELLYRAIKQHGRVVYYMKDTAGKLQFFNEDVARPAEEVIQEIGELFQYCTGQYVEVELREKPIGDGAKGGVTKPAMVFKVLLGNEAASLTQPRAAQAAPVVIPGMPSIYEMFQQNQTLQMQMFELKMQEQLKDLKQERDRYKDEAKSPVIDKATNMLLEKWLNAEDAKAATVKAMHKAPAQNVIVAPLADDQQAAPHPQKEKIKNALKEFKEVDSEYIDNLAFLAEYAKANPVVYKEFIKQLKGGANE